MTWIWHRGSFLSTHHSFTFTQVSAESCRCCVDALWRLLGAAPRPAPRDAELARWEGGCTRATCCCAATDRGETERDREEFPRTDTSRCQGVFRGSIVRTGSCWYGGTCGCWKRGQLHLKTKHVKARKHNAFWRFREGIVAPRDIRFHFETRFWITKTSLSALLWTKVCAFTDATSPYK